MPLESNELHIDKGSLPLLVSYPPKTVKLASVKLRLSTPTHTMEVEGSELTGNVDDFVGIVDSTAAWAGETEIPLTSSPIPPLLPNRRYLCLSSGVTQDVAVVENMSYSGNKLLLASPLPCDFPGFSEVHGYAVTYQLLPGMTDELGRGAVEWIGTDADGNIYKWAQALRVVARQANYQLNASGLVQLSPYAARLQPPADTDFRETIAGAWSRYVVPALQAQGFRVERIISWEALTPFHVAAVEYLLGQTYETDADRRKELKEALLEEQNLLLGSTSWWYDDADDISPPGETSPTGAGWSWTTR